MKRKTTSIIAIVLAAAVLLTVFAVGISVMSASAEDAVSYSWDTEAWTCTATGAVGGETVTETASSTAVEVKSATCTEDGVIAHYAVFSNAAFEPQSTNEPVAALGHNLVTTYEDVAPSTCVNYGKRVVTVGCSRCSYVESKTEVPLGKMNHVWDEGTVEKAATCTEEGVVTYYCANCDGTRTEIIPAEGHVNRNFDDLCDKCGENIKGLCLYCQKYHDQTSLAGRFVAMFHDLFYKIEQIISFFMFK
ncbi:MAG: hypothetical protein IJM45_08895 [Clostridia bacterium]|nr:hypothetical protein [Clostridia bacterium]